MNFSSDLEEKLYVYEHQLRACRNAMEANLTIIGERLGLYPKMTVVGLIAGIDCALGDPLSDDLNVPENER